MSLHGVNTFYNSNPIRFTFYIPLRHDRSVKKNIEILMKSSFEDFVFVTKVFLFFYVPKLVVSKVSTL